ncbi:protein-disulfide reductase DsbD domain-containing protein [Deminuibacter soli]|uniref:Thiol:disulfide interchange protein DsbD N-terminal domain-containing protein n=1 Tax=Deminuibacter soli TaxID=2291815 RepID=A0A3E1NJ32_9BACT|nr:protein-disulfide reductase DsbD domain-containing protein [Deminuibacter soli]RFM27834.1 hypothetical protein DXN05_14160 [Deminuibacter soli]
MKHIFALTIAATMAFVSVRAQDPVQWQYTARKVDAVTWEIHLTATIQAGWHVYAQHQPKDAIASPTAIHFASNPLVKLEGAIKEIGQLQHEKIEALDITQLQYENQVDFVQRVKVKTAGNAAVKTNITGQVNFQTCTETSCLPPETKSFSVKLQ